MSFCCLDRLSQLEAHAGELAAAVRVLAGQIRGGSTLCGRENKPHPLGLPENYLEEAQQARGSILSSLMKMQTLLLGPTDFLQQLMLHTQLLASLQWLGALQVLACIPIGGSVPVKDVAELTGVPEMQLRRIVRMTATTAGFLQQPQPDEVAHSPLSAPFVLMPGYLDAAMFLAETAAPAALQTEKATQLYAASDLPMESPFSLAFPMAESFPRAYEQQPRLQRQWPAYLRYAIGDMDAAPSDVDMYLGPLRVGNSSVVEVDAASTELASRLEKRYPTIRFIVQLSEVEKATWKVDEPPMSSRLIVQYCSNGAPQPVVGAALYLMRIPPSSPVTPVSSILAQLAAQLKLHLGTLRMNTSVSLVLYARLLPDAGSMSVESEAQALLRDVTFFQLSKQREMSSWDIIDLVNSVSDSTGRLVLVKTMRSPKSPIVTFEIRYQELVHF
ncbi:hypothetical protein BJX76DRAFT_364343 [Aspergillus varians]